MYRHLSLIFWSPTATWSSQIDPIYIQISALGAPSSPAGSRRSPGFLKKYFCFNYSPILELVSVSIWVWKRLFSSVFRTTVSARAAKVIRLAREAQSEDVAEAQSGFGVVNNGSKSLSSLFAPKRTQNQLWTLPGSFCSRFLLVLNFRTHPGTFRFRRRFSACEKEAGSAMGELNIPKHPVLEDQLYIGMNIYR